MEVELDNGLYVVANAVNRGNQPLVCVGEHVQIDFVEGGLRTYQIPAQGLDAELALE
jgi:hypothetical protein